jgi:hypothetical protein
MVGCRIPKRFLAGIDGSWTQSSRWIISQVHARRNQGPVTCGHKTGECVTCMRWRLDEDANHACTGVKADDVQADTRQPGIDEELRE